MWNNRKTSSVAVFSLLALSFLSAGLSPELKEGTLRILAAIAPSEKPWFQLKNWGLDESRSNSHIHAYEAWSIETGSASIVVGVIDTGIDASHPDLVPNLWKAPQRLAEGLDDSRKPAKSLFTKKFLKNSKKNKKEKTINEAPELNSVFGWDMVTNSANPLDDHGHGTHVAGIIGAVSNPKEGISGVAKKVSLMPIKYYSVTNSGTTNLRNTIKAIEWAVDNGARVINYSGGGPEFSEAEYMALKKAEAKGVIVVAAAGNEQSNIDQTEHFYYPASYNLSNIVSVSALTIDNKLLQSSNWGPTKVDVAAPGENIYSTLPRDPSGKVRYGYMSGTSQATAFVTGVVALLLSKDPSLTPMKVKELLVATVDPLPSLQGKIRSNGRINAYQALLALTQKSKPEKDVKALRFSQMPGSSLASVFGGSF